MNVSCPSCKTRYSVDDSRVPPTGVTIRCPKCSHTFVAKRPDASPQRQQSAVALPGSVGTPEAPPPSRASSAVALPGSVAQQSRIPPSSTDAGDLDLGLDDTPPPSPSPAGGIPSDLPAPRASSGPAQSFDDGVLDFIDDNVGRAGPGAGEARSASIEYKVRRRNGRVEGPFGVHRIKAMLRAKDLTGGEDISEDGVQWRAMTSHPELNAAINEIAAAADAMSFGNVDLPAPQGTDLPGTRDMPDLASPRPGGGGGGGVSAGGMGMGHTGGSGLELDDNSPPAPPPRMAPDRTPSSMDDLMGDLDLDDDLPPEEPLAPPPGGAEGAVDAAMAEGGDMERAPRMPDDLEVGEIPELPPIWKTYKKPILAFAGVATLILVGVFTHLFTKCGPFGVVCGYEMIMAEEAPPPPPKPPPPPPKVADPKEVAGLIDEGSYEAFRSVFATIQSAGPTLPDNMLQMAKARGFATLYYGPAAFPLADLTKSVEALNTVDLGKAMGGNAAAANVEILKARSALEILTAQGASASTQLAGLLEQRADDKEIALLLGLARSSTKDYVGALEALDKAIVASPNYAPALHAIGDVVQQTEGSNVKVDAAAWYEKAFAAQPSHARSGLAAVKIYEQLHHYGERRRALVRIGKVVQRGLSPDERAPLLLKTVQDFDREGRIKEVAALAHEGARLEPADPKYVALSATAWAESGNSAKGLTIINQALGRSPTDVDALIARARIYNDSDDIAKGFLDLAAAKTASPRDYRPPLWEARFHLALGKMTDARASLKRAIRVGKDVPDPSIELGRLDLSEGNVDAAFEHAQNAVKIDPNRSAGHVLLGDCFTARGQLDKALETYRKASELDDELLMAQLGYANTLRQLGGKQRRPAESKELAEAIPIYLQILRDRPGNPQALFEYGRALELTGDVGAAVALYKEAATLDEKDVRPHLKMVQAYLDQEEPDVKAAAKSLARAVKIETQAGAPTAEVAFWNARVALAEDRVHDAVAAMRNAVESEQNNAEFAFWLGRCLERNQSLYEAITYYEKAITLNSRLAKAHRAIGWTAIERHQFEKAREAFQRYRKSAPDDPSIWFDIGESYTRQNLDDKAMGAFQKAVSANPNHAEALLQIGIIQSRKGKSKKAIGFYERAVKANPMLSHAWCSLGIAQSQRGVTKKSRRALEKCLSFKDAPADMRENAKEILEAG